MRSRQDLQPGRKGGPAIQWCCSMTVLILLAACDDDNRRFEPSPEEQDAGPVDLGSPAGCLDEDGDRYGIGTECLGTDLPDRAGVVDQNARIYPGAPEICDGEDNDLNGVIDSKDPGFIRDPCPLTLGVCAQRGRPCIDGSSGSCNDDYGREYMKDEVQRCDGLDNDCDGQTDEGCECVDGANRWCGECGDGLQICEEGQWGRCLGGSAPRAEVCNGRDDDCNGVVDDPPICGACPFEMAYLEQDRIRFCIDRYEASRQDATSANTGLDDESPAISREQRLPWTEVSWSAARAACERAGKKLCSSVQWLATCGVGGGSYPYGREYIAGRCHDQGDGRATPYSTGSHPDCVVTPPGSRPIYDISGNVREWLGDVFPDNQRQAQGGSYQDEGAATRCSVGVLLDASSSEPMTGFRCCKNN